MRAPSGASADELGSEVVGFAYECPKCGCKDHERSELRTSGLDGDTHVLPFDPATRLFVLLTCTQCRYTEIYQQTSISRPVAVESEATPLDAELATTEPPTEEEHWIEIVLLDDQGQPRAGERYFVELPDGTSLTGRLNSEGKAKVVGVEPGTAKVSFPDYHKESYEKQ